MMKCWSSIGAFLILIASPLYLHATDITGTWTASFDTQIGRQNYTYVFKVEDTVLTGKIKSGNGEAVVEDGTVEGDSVSFIEHMNYRGNSLRIGYSGKIISDDEINFTRTVGEFDTEQLIARRVKSGRP